MQSQLNTKLRVLILLLLGGAGFTFVLSGCVTYYGKEPDRYSYHKIPPPAEKDVYEYDPAESAPPPVAESPIFVEPAAPIPVFPQPPLMAWDSRFEMYFVLDSPYDLFFYGGYYYVFANGGWYRSVSYNGSWLYTERVLLPPVFHNHRLEDLRHYREGMNRDYRMRPNAYRERMFDHHEDRFRDRYDREFMEHNREQMRRDREFYSHHESPTNRTVSERREPPAGNHENFASKGVSENHGTPVGNREPLANKAVPEKHESSAANHEPIASRTVLERHEPPGLKQEKKLVKKPPAQRTAHKKAAPKELADKPEEKR